MEGLESQIRDGMATVAPTKEAACLAIEGRAAAKMAQLNPAQLADLQREMEAMGRECPPSNP